ncbi:MAG: hypothetical protein J6O09_02225 [Lachnospiraceae bacterium]|nr:hypothetical protein [Lachnospiraceae bacterium]
MKKLHSIIKRVLVAVLIVASVFTTGDLTSYASGQVSSLFKDKYIGDLDYKNLRFLSDDLYDMPGIYAPSVSNEVIVGKNDWMYSISQDEKKILSCERFLSDSWIQNTSELMIELDNLCKQYGKKAYYMMCPGKELVYPEYLPDNYYVKASDIDDIEIFSEYLKNTLNINFIYPLNYLKNAKNYVRLYFKNDGHWNQIGGYIATEELYEKMGLTPKPLSFCDIIKNPYGSVNNYDYNLTYKGDGEIIEFNTNGKELAYADLVNAKSTAPDSRTVTLIGNSFRYFIFDVIAKDFKASNLIHKSALNLKVSKRAIKNSDIIIFQFLTSEYKEVPGMIKSVINTLKP